MLTTYWRKIFHRSIAERPLISPSVVRGPRVEVVSGATGRFGYDRTNPVPVSFVWGEQAYLEALRCGCGVGFSFKRAGSVGLGPDGHILDLYELVCANGVHHASPFFDMYHRGMTALIPDGMTRSEGPEG
jgi:hypothetical protein